MLKLNELKPAPGAVKNKKRIGRGTGSGSGSTAGKGNNGDRARSGSKTKLYFEGGQTPLTRRIPKKGFRSPFKVEYQIVNVSSLEDLKAEADEITVEFLHSQGLVHELDRPVKILGNGELTKALNIKVHAFSRTAKEKIEKNKGKAEVIGRA
ncbi:MAG: 50S ribosomal protein L15 [Fibrobacter sp.]|nr:50S ribosomal protein L15 [Fibrobacter sp.]